jgi:hypothetical protein
MSAIGADQADARRPDEFMGSPPDPAKTASGSRRRLASPRVLKSFEEFCSGHGMPAAGKINSDPNFLF